MKIIKTLIIKDYYEFKNNWLKIGSTFVMVTFIPLCLFNYMGINESILRDTNVLSEIIVILILMILYADTTLFQIRRDINNGVFEKYYINKKIKGLHLLLSKYIVNLIFTIISVMLIAALNPFFGYFITDQITFKLSGNFIILLILSCMIGTCSAFINALVIADEKNAITYGGMIFGTYLGYYKLLEQLDITGFFIEFLGLFIICGLLILLVLNLIQKNKFIRKF